MAKTSINVKPCNIGSTERHNLRSKELDYIRPELSHRNEQCTGGHKGKIQAPHRTVHAEEGDTHPRGSGRDRGRHDTPVASGLCREDRGTLRNTHVPNLHAQGRGSQRLERKCGNMEAKLPCAHDFRLDGWGNGENPEAEQAGHGGNAGYTGRMPWHGKRHFFDRKHLSATQYRIWSKRRKRRKSKKNAVRWRMSETP